MNAFADHLQQALSLLDANRTQEAAATLESICKMQPGSATDCFSQGVAQHWLGRLDPALTAFDRALTLDPVHLDALNARGTVLHAMGRRTEAQATYEQALALTPGNAQVLTNLAIVLEAQDAFDEAVARYEEALATASCYRPALLNLSALLLRLERPQDALTIAQRLVEAHPDAMEAHQNLAATLLALDGYAQAQAAAEKALAIAPASVAARIILAVAQACQGAFDAALASFRLARATDPKLFADTMRTVWAHGDPARANWPRGTDALPDPRVLFLARGVFRLARCDWSGRDAFIEHMHRIVRDSEAVGAPVCEFALPFASMWLPLADDVRYAIASAVGNAIERITASARLPLPARRAARPERLHIGYLTPNASDHPNVTLTAPMIASHDRDRFDVTGYVLNAPDHHPMAVQFRSSCDRARECHGQSDAAVARRIRDDGIDILIDLAGHTDLARPEIMAMRPARLQCTYLGHPGTTGGSWCDYRISDPISTPATSQCWWTEALALLPRSMFACEPVSLPAALPDRRAERLPDAGFVFCAFHTSNKIDPSVFSVWLRLLQQVPDSVLWLTASGATARHLHAEAIARGLDPSRLVFAQRHPRREDHLGRLRLADLYLDTPCYNAHTTAVEALYVGVPVLTCTGIGPASSVAASIVHEADLDELIVSDLAQYEARALQLARSPHELQTVRQDWNRRRVSCRLFDPPDLATAMERAFDHMWARYAAGLLPLPFQLDARER